MTLLFAFMVPSLGFGQNLACSLEEHNQFDFWIGQWEVFDTTGKKLGENTISKQFGNCILDEQWVSQGQGRGTSHSFFDLSDSSWNQLWLDNQGTILPLKGRFEGDRMVMRSKELTNPKGEPYYSQISWVNNADGTVSQIWETFTPAGELKNTLFHGVYRRKSAEQSAEE